MALHRERAVLLHLRQRIVRRPAQIGPDVVVEPVVGAARVPGLASQIVPVAWALGWAGGALGLDLADPLALPYDVARLRVQLVHLPPGVGVQGWPLDLTPRRHLLHLLHVLEEALAHLLRVGRGGPRAQRRDRTAPRRGGHFEGQMGPGEQKDTRPCRTHVRYLLVTVYLTRVAHHVYCIYCEQ